MHEMAAAYRRAPDDADIALEYAGRLEAHGDRERARRVLRQAVRDHPDRQPVRVRYLQALLALRMPDSVVAVVRDAPAGDAPSAVEYVLVAQAFRRMGDADSALTAYDRAVHRAPADAVVRFAYARALAAAHRRRSATAELERAVRLGPLPPAAVAALRSRIGAIPGTAPGRAVATGASR